MPVAERDVVHPPASIASRSPPELISAGLSIGGERVHHAVSDDDAKSAVDRGRGLLALRGRVAELVLGAPGEADHLDPVGPRDRVSP